jgi:predicted nucleic acid-binding protein
MTLTLELSDTLAQQLKERQVNEKEIKAIALAALEIWLTVPESSNERRFSESALPFVNQIISKNRPLFLALAQR